MYIIWKYFYLTYLKCFFSSVFDHKSWQIYLFILHLSVLFILYFFCHISRITPFKVEVLVYTDVDCFLIEFCMWEVVTTLKANNLLELVCNTRKYSNSNSGITLVVLISIVYFSIVKLLNGKKHNNGQITAFTQVYYSYII